MCVCVFVSLVVTGRACHCPCRWLYVWVCVTICVSSQFQLFLSRFGPVEDSLSHVLTSVFDSGGHLHKWFHGADTTMTPTAAGVCVCVYLTRRLDCVCVCVCAGQFLVRYSTSFPRCLTLVVQSSKYLIYYLEVHIRRCVSVCLR